MWHADRYREEPSEDDFNALSLTDESSSPASPTLSTLYEEPASYNRKPDLRSHSPNLGKTFPDTLLFTIDELKLNRPRGRFFVRISYRTDVRKTVKDSDLTTHTGQTFAFPCSFHALIFDSIKVDVLEHRAVGYDYHIGRAVITLAKLLETDGDMTGHYRLRARRASGARSQPPSSSGSVPDSDFSSSNANGEVKVTLGLTHRRHRKSSVSRSISDPVRRDSGAHVRRCNSGSATADSRAGNRVIRNTVSSSNMHAFSGLSGKTPLRRQGSKKEISPQLSTASSASTCYEFGDDVNDDFTADDYDVMAEMAEEDDDYDVEDDDDDGSIDFGSKKKRFVDKIFSGETVAIMKEFSIIYNTYFKSGWQISKMDFMKAMVVLFRYYKDKPNPLTGVQLEGTEDLEQSLYYIRYMMASYGSAMLNIWGHGSGIKDAVRLQSDRKSVCDEFHLQDPRDVIAWEFTKSAVYVPKYYIVRDPATNALVVVLRGTFSVKDTLTDLLCEYDPFEGGFAHRGILKSAQYILTHELDNIRAAIRKFNVTGIFCVGHSLGGAVSSLVAVMLREHIDELSLLTSDRHFDIRSYTIGSPPSVSREIAKKTEHFIVSVVNEADAVPRLSFGNVILMKEIIKGIVEIQKDPVIRAMPKRARHHHLTEMIDRHRDLWLRERSHTKLFIPGKMVYLYKAKHAGLGPLTSREKSQMRVEVSVAEHFSDLGIRKNVLMHHLPDGYEKRIKRAIDWMKKE